MVQQEAATSSKRFLFVVSNRFNPVGGHLLSGVSLANRLSQMGHQVGLLVHPTSIPDLDTYQVATHYAIYKDGPRRWVKRSYDILNTIQKNNYNIVIAMDYIAARHASLAVILLGLPLVQVIAGGRARSVPPLNLPGIILFSEELREDLQKQHGFSTDNLLVSPGRVDFNGIYQQLSDCPEGNRLEFDNRVHRILAVSRLKGRKTPAISTLLQEVACAGQHQRVQLRIIGEGDARATLEKDAETVVQNSNDMIDIKFLGGFRVSPCDLVQADLVVGQGRTVVEAIACGVPASVCGYDGYFGLINHKSILTLAATNFTGRSIHERTTLLDDLQKIEEFKRDEFVAVRNQIRELYDVQHGAGNILQAVDMVSQELKQKRLPRLYMTKLYFRDLLNQGIHNLKLVYAKSREFLR